MLGAQDRLSLMKTRCCLHKESLQAPTVSSTKTAALRCAGTKRPKRALLPWELW